ncbi:MAG: hypothetical protein ACLTTH_13170 [Holdemanella porci]
MTYKEFYGSDYDTFKNVLDKVLNTIHSSVLACIQYTTSRIKLQSGTTSRKKDLHKIDKF